MFVLKTHMYEKKTEIFRNETFRNKNKTQKYEKITKTLGTKHLGKKTKPRSSRIFRNETIR